MSKAELTEISMWKFFGATSNQVINGRGGGGGEEVLFKGLTESLRSRGPTHYPFVCHFDRKGTPFVYLQLEKVLVSNDFTKH